MSNFKYIDLIGLEVEAGWSKHREDLIKDDSLQVDGFRNAQCIGELVSKPLASLQEAFDFCRKNWPDESTERCAMHIHVSFKSIPIYGQTMTQKFFEEFLAAVEKWGIEYPCANLHFWNRLFDKNKYCRRRFQPQLQMHITKDTKHNNQERRTILNYSYSCHKTLECRLFPTFNNVNTACSAIEFFINFVENYLENNPLNSQEIVLQLDLDDEINNTREVVINTRYNYFDRTAEEDIAPILLNTKIDTSNAPKVNNVRFAIKPACPKAPLPAHIEQDYISKASPGWANQIISEQPYPAYDNTGYDDGDIILKKDVKPLRKPKKEFSSYFTNITNITNNTNY